MYSIFETAHYRNRQCTILNKEFHQQHLKGNVSNEKLYVQSYWLLHMYNEQKMLSIFSSRLQDKNTHCHLLQHEMNCILGHNSAL